jgi:hypothetical protein
VEETQEEEGRGNQDLFRRVRGAWGRRMRSGLWVVGLSTRETESGLKMDIEEELTTEGVRVGRRRDTILSGFLTYDGTF